MCVKEEGRQQRTPATPPGGRHRAAAVAIDVDGTASRREGGREGGREPCLPACWLSPLPAGAAAAPPTRRQAERVAESERDLFFPSSTPSVRPSSERGPPVRPSVSVPPAPRTGVLVNGGGTKGGSHRLMNTLADGYSRDNFNLNAQERRRQKSTHRGRTY